MEPASNRSTPVRTLGHLALALAAILAVAPTARADAGATLELFLGPHETTTLTLRSVTLQVDDAVIQVPLPPPLADPSQPVYRAPISPGEHTVKVTVSAAGQSVIFTYLDLYGLDLKGRLDLLAPAAGSVRVTARIRSSDQLDADFLGRYRLDFSAVRTALPLAEADEPDDEPETTPAMHVATPTGCRLGPVSFAVASAELDPRGRATLDRFAACLRQSGVRVTLEGHCDRSGSDELNQRLGMERAAAAAEYLQAQGIPKSRVTVVSRGSALPACESPSKDCYARNRRVVGVVPVLDAGAPRSAAGQ